AKGKGENIATGEKGKRGMGKGKVFRVVFQFTQPLIPLFASSLSPFPFSTLSPPFVKLRLPLRSRLPALMNPQPLVRIHAHHPLHCRGNTRYVHVYVLIVVCGSIQLDWWVTVEKITFSFLIPHCAGGNYYRISLQRQRGDAGSCAGKLAKERNKKHFACLRVEVGQDAKRAAFA